MQPAGFHPTDPTPVERPPCDECGQPMYLTRIEPAEPGHDRRLFECPLCGHTTTHTVLFRPVADPADG